MKQCYFITTIVLLFLYGCSHDQKNQAAAQKDYLLGNKLFKAGKPDSAYLVYTRFVNSTDDISKKGAVYRYMGQILWQNGDLHGAEENLAAGIHTLDPSNEDHRAEMGYLYNLLGNVNLDLHHYDSAIAYYNDALPFLSGNPYLFEAMNGKATVLQKKKRYKEAIAIYDSIFLLQPTKPRLIARIFDNRARTKWLQESTYPALPEYWLALQNRTDSQYNADLTASYAHLADYYEKTNPDSALWYANHMLAKAKANNSPDDVLEALDKLIRLNNTAAVKELYSQSKKLDDSLQLARDTTRNRFAMIRYDYQKSKADNLVLQQNFTKQRLLTYGVIAFAIIVIIILSIWYSKRRNRIKQQSENAIRDSKLKMSQKVHDVVANGLYVIMNKLEHDETIDKEVFLNHVEELYEKSRDISYEESVPGNTADYNSQVSDLLTAFINAQTNVIVIGNEQTFWNKITATQKDELQLILKEIMVNMKKHSHAKNVVIEFKQENKKGFINYKDDGVGFPAHIELGNGLKNTVNRIKSLKGEVIFGKSDKAGAATTISFPLEPGKK